MIFNLTEAERRSRLGELSVSVSKEIKRIKAAKDFERLLARDSLKRLLGIEFKTYEVRNKCED